MVISIGCKITKKPQDSLNRLLHTLCEMLQSAKVMVPPPLIAYRNLSCPLFQTFRNILRQVLLDNQKDNEQYTIFQRNYDFDSFPFSQNVIA